jgi:hypothetical protein
MASTLKLMMFFVGMASFLFFGILGYLAFSELNFTPYKSMYTMSEAFLAKDAATVQSLVDEEAIAENLYAAVENEERDLKNDGVTRKIWLDPRAKVVVKPVLKRSIRTSITDCVEEHTCLPQINDPNGKNLLTLHPLVLFTAMALWLHPTGGLFSSGAIKTYEGSANGETYRVIFEKEPEGDKRWILTGVFFPEITSQLLNGAA